MGAVVAGRLITTPLDSPVVALKLTTCLFIKSATYTLPSAPTATPVVYDEQQGLTLMVSFAAPVNSLYESTWWPPPLVRKMSARNAGAQAANTKASVAVTSRSCLHI